MGMFDSLYDKGGNEWQTKAYECLLTQYEVGMPIGEDRLFDYQVEVLGSIDDAEFVDSFATVRGGVLAEVPTDRDSALPLMDYGGGWLEGGDLW